MAIAYNLIASNTVGSPVASVTFSSIAGTYTDLVLAVSARSASTGNAWDSLTLEFNGSGGAAYSTRMLYGDGGTAAGAVSTGNSFVIWGHIPSNSATSNTFGNTLINIPNYTSGNYKSLIMDSVAETNAATTIMTLTGSVWANTAAITSIKCANYNATNFMQYSTFFLYGILKY